MNIFKTIKHKSNTVFRKPRSLLIKLLYASSYMLPPKLYLKMLFPLKVGYKLNLDNPQSYNEKLQWLKLYYRNPLLPKLVDKYEYKEYVKKSVGEQFVIKTYGVWTSVEEIDFDNLPSQFVLKTTHDQGGVIVCQDKSNFDITKAKKKLQKHLNRNLYYLFREWVYNNVQPRIIAEEYLEDISGEGLKDYKFYCFDGEAKLMYITCGKQTGVNYIDFYDMDFNYVDIKRPKFKQFGDNHIKPKNWDLMIAFAKKMSQGQPHVRIDFYNVNDKLYFGEFTLFQGGGLMPFYPEKWDYILGEYINLPKLK